MPESDSHAPHGSSTGANLTARELLVLQLLVRQITPRQIALLLDMPLTGVWRLIRRAVRHLGAGSLPEAMEIARRRGLVV